MPQVDAFSAAAFAMVLIWVRGDLAGTRVAVPYVTVTVPQSDNRKVQPYLNLSELNHIVAVTDTP